MAGRGINITCEFEGDLLCLNVARHAPLYILIDELSEKTGVQAELQSIVLIDEHDETDSRLLDNGDIPLYHLGLRDGSRLILTALDDVADWQETEIVPVPKQAELTQDPMAEFFLLQPPAGSPRAAAPSSVSPTQAVHRRRLDTPIQPRRANHSFNGVMFDIKPNGPYEVMVSSMWVGGMMGSVTVWACDQAWCGDDNSQRVASSWGHGYHIVDQSHWEQIAARYCPPSWDIPAEIVFDHPVRIKPGQIRALYIHSALPDDLGIQYQSFRGADAITSDDIVTLLPGVGHSEYHSKLLFPNFRSPAVFVLRLTGLGVLRSGASSIQLWLVPWAERAGRSDLVHGNAQDMGAADAPRGTALDARCRRNGT